jgi:hypothetical protein
MTSLQRTVTVTEVTSAGLRLLFFAQSFPFELVTDRFPIFGKRQPANRQPENRQ